MLVGLSSSSEIPPPDLSGSPRAVSASLLVCMTFSMTDPGRMSLAFGFFVALAFLARFLNAYTRKITLRYFPCLIHRFSRPFLVRLPWICCNTKTPWLYRECRKTRVRSRWWNRCCKTHTDRGSCRVCCSVRARWDFRSPPRSPKLTRSSTRPFACFYVWRIW